MTLLKSAFLARFQLSEKHRREELGFCSGALCQREGSRADVSPWSQCCIPTSLPLPRLSEGARALYAQHILG